MSQSKLRTEIYRLGARLDQFGRWVDQDTLGDVSEREKAGESKAANRRSSRFWVRQLEYKVTETNHDLSDRLKRNLDGPHEIDPCIPVNDRGIRLRSREYHGDIELGPKANASADAEKCIVSVPCTTTKPR